MLARPVDTKSARMEGEPPTQASTPAGAVFLSYASEDADAARRICDALRASGIEVWFDQSELRGGDAWDRKIRDQIHDCRLFIPLISGNTERRDEGYFRREWTLAADRTRDMAHKRTFLVPVVIDGTSERGASVPEKFHELQWTRLPSGETPLAFVERIKRLLAPDAGPVITTTPPSTNRPTSTPSVRRSSFSKPAIWGVSAIAATAFAYLVADKFWLSKPPILPPPEAAPTVPQTTSANSPAAFNPPPHSIAVLPFVNMSGDAKQEYFSDGLTEEILNALARIDELHVAARTSAFSFKGKDTDVGTIARKLNVGAILEGSVRRSANTVRITTQLIDASSGYHLWSETYDRNLGDVLKLETDIATAVAGALKVRLLENQAEKIEVGGTRNPLAFNAYLRGRKTFQSAQGAADAERMFAEFDEAVRLDPQYARAVAARSIAGSLRADFATSPSQAQELLVKAEADARHAIALAPELSDGHGALGAYFGRMLQPVSAANEFARALQLSPGNAYALAAAGGTAVELGRTDAGLGVMRRAAILDPLSASIQYQLGYGLSEARRYDEAIAAYDAALALQPKLPFAMGMRGLTYYLMGNLESARRACDIESDDLVIQVCRAILYARLGRHADAQAAFQTMQSKVGDAAAYEYARIYGQWGDVPTALMWLEKALQLKDSDLSGIKVDPLIDPLRQEPRFQAVMRELKFPE